MEQEYKLDLKDKKILYGLETNARQSFPQIAKKVKLSKEVVNYRVKNLLQKGIIKNFSTIIDISKLGYAPFRVFLKFQNTTLKKEQEIIDYLTKQKNIGWIVSVKGNWNINFVTWNKNNTEFNEFWKRFLEKYKQFIKDYKTSIITKLYHYKKEYLLDKKESSSEEIIIGSNEESKFDELDKEILDLLSKNSRITSLEISEKIKSTEKFVRDRIKRLIKNKIILGFRAVLDLEKLGYEYYKLHLTLDNFQKENTDKLLQYALKNPNIIYHTETIGGYDFELDIQVKNNKELYNIIKEIKNKFPNLIRDFEFMEYDQEYKLIYLPQNT